MYVYAFYLHFYGCKGTYFPEKRVKGVAKKRLFLWSYEKNAYFCSPKC